MLCNNNQDIRDFDAKLEYSIKKYNININLETNILLEACNNYDKKTVAVLIDSFSEEYGSKITASDAKSLALLHLINSYVRYEHEEALETINYLLFEEKVNIQPTESLDFTHADSIYIIERNDAILQEVLKSFEKDNYCIAYQDRIKLLEVIQLLIDAGADINARDQQYNKTPLQYVMNEHYINEDASIIKLLLSNGAILSNIPFYVIDNDFESIDLKNNIIQNEIIKRGYADINNSEDSQNYVMPISDYEFDLDLDNTDLNTRYEDGMKVDETIYAYTQFLSDEARIGYDTFTDPFIL